MGKVDLGSFNGQPISREDFLAAQREAKLNHFMRSGGREWPATDENGRKTLERDTIFRLFLLDKIKDLDIHVSEQAVARAARDHLGDYPPDKFEHDFLLREGLTLEDKMGLPLRDYAFHGGGFPIRIVGVGCVGVVAVSGLPQREDHELVTAVLAEMCGIALEAVPLS